MENDHQWKRHLILFSIQTSLVFHFITEEEKRWNTFWQVRSLDEEREIVEDHRSSTIHSADLLLYIVFRISFLQKIRLTRKRSYCHRQRNDYEKNVRAKKLPINDKNRSNEEKERERICVQWEMLMSVFLCVDRMIFKEKNFR